MRLILVGGDGGYSGVPTYIGQLIRALGRQADILVLSDRNQGGYDFVPEQGARHQTIVGLKSGLSPWHALRAARQLSRVIGDQRPDLVWAHARMAVLLVRVVSIARRLTGKPTANFAVTFHGLPFGPGHRWLAARISVLAERLLLRLSPPHHIHFLSDDARDTYARAMGRAVVARHRVHVLQNCSAIGPIGPRPVGRAERVLLMTSRAGFQKNPVLAARIMARMPDNYRLVLVGAGTDSPEMKALFARHMGATATRGRVRFAGPQADVRPFLAQADGFLLTSRYEGAPIGALEGFEAGLPLATTVVSGTRAILQAHPMAVAIDPDNPSASAQRITDMVEGYLADRDTNTARIAQAWRTEFSYEVWEPSARHLATRLVIPPVEP